MRKSTAEKVQKEAVLQVWMDLCGSSLCKCVFLRKCLEENTRKGMIRYRKDMDKLSKEHRKREKKPEKRDRARKNRQGEATRGK